MRYMWVHDGWFSVVASSSGFLLRRWTVYAPQAARRRPSAVRSIGFPLRRRWAGAAGSGVRARSGTRSQGRTKKGEMIATARRFPYFTGRVAHPPARSPAASEKSFVEAAPSRNRPNTDPMAQGSAENAEATSVQPATLRRHPRGTAIVTFAHIPKRFVRPKAGTVFILMVRRPPRNRKKHWWSRRGAPTRARSPDRAGTTIAHV